MGPRFVTGPIFGAVVVFVDFSVGNLEVNQFTAPGYISCLFGILGLLAIVFLFDEFRPPSTDLGPVPHKERVPFGEVPFCLCSCFSFLFGSFLFSRSSRGRSSTTGWPCSRS